ncbi:MAG TPA: DALR domain-containing protein, partial [Anaerolineaceae bacterium]
PALPGSAGAPQDALDGLRAKMDATKAGFIEAMDDDFNTAGALGSLFELVRVINQARADGADDAQLRPAQDLLRELTSVLGLTLKEDAASAQAADPFVQLLVDVRMELRKQKLWVLSDLVRDRLTALGVSLEDSKEGTTWRYNG